MRAVEYRYDKFGRCVCGSERKEKEEGQGRGKASTANGYCPRCPVVDGVGEGLWLSLHCARFSPVVSTATENTVVCL